MQLEYVRGTIAGVEATYCRHRGEDSCQRNTEYYRLFLPSWKCRVRHIIGNRSLTDGFNHSIRLRSLILLRNLGWLVGCHAVFDDWILWRPLLYHAMGETAVGKNGIYRHHIGGESDTQTCQNNDCRALLPSFWGLTMNYCVLHRKGARIAS